MNDFTFEEVEQLQEDIKNKQYDENKLLSMLDEYKWLLEFKPFQNLVDTQPVSTEALYDACQAYARWYGYTQYNRGIQNILFLDGWRHDNINDCELFLHPMYHMRKDFAEKLGMEIDEKAWLKSKEDKWAKEREDYYRDTMELR